MDVLIYRKASKNDIKCSECSYHVPPNWYQKRIRCMLYDYNNISGFAVGKNMTCNRAENQK